MKKIYSLASLIVGISLLFAHNLNAQYCVPTQLQTTWEIVNVNTTGGISNFNNTSGNANQGYVDYSQQHQVVTSPGGTFTVEVNKTGMSSMFVDWFANGDFADPGDLIANQGYVSGYTRLNKWTQTITVPANAVKGKNLRLRVMTGSTSSSTYQRNPCDWLRTWSWGNSVYLHEVEDYNVFVTIDHNAAMHQIAQPLVECNGSAGTKVDIKFKNAGIKDIDTCSFGGVVCHKLGFRTPIPRFTWTGNLKAGEVSPNINIFTSSGSPFKAGDTVKVWSMDPNNVTDSIGSDDTLSYVVLGGMEGEFSIGDTTGGKHDFVSLKHALDSLETAGAICDSVIFNLSDTSYMTYKGQYYIKDILGLSPTSPIIIRNIDTNKYITNITWDSCTKKHNYTFNLENVSNIYFEGIDFTTERTKGTGYSSVFRSVNSSNIYFTKCKFMNQDQNQTNENYSLVNADGCTNINFNKSSFVNGSKSLAVTNTDLVIVNECTITNPGYMGLSLVSVNGAELIRNTFKSTSTRLGNTFAMYLEKVNSKLEISYNTVLTSNGQWPTNGIRMTECNALNSTANTYNNMINLGQAWSGQNYYGISMINSVGQNILFNNIVVSGNNQNNCGLYSNNGTRNTLFNNILAAPINGYALNLPVAASIVSSDHNDLYSAARKTARIGSTDYNTLAAWQTATGFDKNSKDVDPQFYSIAKNDLHVCNDKLFAAGKSFSAPKDDWDGDVRDTKNPCIGADEFAPVSTFSLGQDYGLCKGDTTYLTAGKGLTGELAIWKDASGTIIDTIRTLMVTTPGKYDVSLLNPCGVNADSIEIIAPVDVKLGADTNMCPDKTLNVDASIANDDKYLWSTGESKSNINVTKAGTYYVTATDAWKCVSSDSIVVSYSNAANLNTNDTIICEGKDLQFFGGISTTEPQVSYSWRGWDGAAAQKTENVFVGFIDNPDSIIYCELTHRGCVTVDSCKIDLKPLPKVSGLVVTMNGKGLYVNSNNSTGANHHWDFGDTNSSSWATPRYRYAKNGVYTVIYTNSNICGNADTTFEVQATAVSLSELNNDSKMLIYPNPNNGSFNVSIEELNASNIELTILDSRGRVVYAKQLDSNNTSFNEIIDLTSQQTGMYILKLKFDDEVRTSRISIQ